ncbi:MAG: Na+:solute symporter [Candidatus Aminicenantes bacterium]|nr:Na+:solute symporter [Candidatus Aminicenantes bacterium]
MLLNTFDWLFMILFFILSLAIGLAVTKRAGRSSEDFFVSGRSMPWWLLGISMVATTFSTDTPNLVTDIVRTHGVAGNWVWFAFLITGMITVFIYARLWKRSRVLTDIEFYELRYSGKTAAFLRGFRALYLGLLFNIVIMATVTLAAIKIGGVLLGISPVTTVVISGSIVVIYSTLGGLTGVLITDFFQFFVAMFGAFAVAVYAVKLPQVGGLSNLITHPAVRTKISLLPNFSDMNTLMAIFVIPLAVQWWAAWYPGAEPGGGGYIAQRMFAAKNEDHAIGATFLFNVTHYALRPWPWIIVALASMIVFPDLASLRKAFPHVDPSIIKNDMAYPAMISFLPHGLLGVVVTSLTAAYMSTISTHLNWGASYIVNDFYKRFIKPGASEKELVLVGRISTLFLMIIAGIFALLLSNALQAFHLILQIGAGTGLLFLLRWFWWRINAISELTAMIVSFVVAVFFSVYEKLGFTRLKTWQEFTIGVVITTISWVVATYLSRPTEEKTLLKFYKLVKPGGPGWNGFIKRTQERDLETELSKGWEVPSSLLNVFLGCIIVYSTLFSVGLLLTGKNVEGAITTAIAILASFALAKNWKRKSPI